MIDLVETIKNNPGCRAEVDNDCWTLFDKDGNVIADDSSIDRSNLPDDGYGSGSCYGGDLLQALARICGITVESV